MLKDPETDNDDVGEGDKDDVTDTVGDTDAVCDGDGPLGVVLLLVEEVNVEVSSNVEETDSEGDKLTVTVGVTVVVEEHVTEALVLMDGVIVFVNEVLPLEE